MEYLTNYFWPCLTFIWACYLWEAYLGYRQVFNLARDQMNFTFNFTTRGAYTEQLKQYQLN